MKPSRNRQDYMHGVIVAALESLSWGWLGWAGLGRVWILLTDWACGFGPGWTAGFTLLGMPGWMATCLPSCLTGQLPESMLSFDCHRQVQHAPHGVAKCAGPRVIIDLFLRRGPSLASNSVGAIVG